MQTPSYHQYGRRRLRDYWPTDFHRDTLSDMGGLAVKEILELYADEDSGTFYPERRMICAIFERAVRDLRLSDYDERQARTWLLSERKEEGSSNWYADLIDIKPILEAVRKIIREGKEKTLFDNLDERGSRGRPKLKGRIEHATINKTKSNESRNGIRRFTPEAEHAHGTYAQDS